MVSPFRDGTVFRGGTPWSKRTPKPRQSRPRVDFQTTDRSPSPEHPTTSCSLFSSPDDLGRRRQAITAPEKPPAGSYQPPTCESSEADNRRAAIRLVSDGSKCRAPHTSYTMKAPKHESNRGEPCTRVLGEASNPIFGLVESRPQALETNSWKTQLGPTICRF